MTSIIVEMHAIPARQHELVQTLHDLASLIHQERGAIDIRIHMDTNDRNRLTLIEEWETQETLARYMESDLFQILRGALKLLTSFSDISFNLGNSGHLKNSEKYSPEKPTSNKNDTSENTEEEV